MDSNSLLGLIKNLERITKGITTGISSAAVKDTSIIITFANGSKQTIAFPKPKDGISIEDIKVEGNKLITILSDGSKKEVELEGLSQGGGTITDQTTTETGNTITTITNGNIKSVTEKDNTGKIVSDKVLVNDKDLSEIIQDGSEWATKEDVNSVLSDTYNELGW